MALRLAALGSGIRAAASFRSSTSSSSGLAQRALRSCSVCTEARRREQQSKLQQQQHQWQQCRQQLAAHRSYHATAPHSDSSAMVVLGVGAVGIGIVARYTMQAAQAIRQSAAEADAAKAATASAAAEAAKHDANSAAAATAAAAGASSPAPEQPLPGSAAAAAAAAEAQKSSGWFSNPLGKRFYDGGFEQTMTRREAALVLGVRESASPQRIKDAHRRILMLNHPDKGGSTYMAGKINAAKELLLKGKGK
jgi:DnaJ homolog subfamily C member 19